MQDSALFRQSIGEVIAIKQETIEPEQTHRPKPLPRRELFNPEQTLLKRVDAPSVVGLEDSLQFAIDGLRPTVFKKMQQGYFGIDAEMDLHGLTTAAAKKQLLYFIHDCVASGSRCVHIVHGKGYRSAELQPVLKNQLNLWLRQHPDVQAFCSASNRHGGAGAVLVLLRLAEKYHPTDKFFE